MRNMICIMKNRMRSFAVRLLAKDEGIDGILVTVGLCIIALLLCVVMKDSLQKFIENIMEALTREANKILTGVAN